MIIFINGPFGVGKTTLAEKLVEQIPNSLLFDPEEIGYMLCKVVAPVEKPYDFQDLPMWRTLVVATAQTLRQNYQRTLIMPMTIWQLPYFEEVVGELHHIEPSLYHFCLTANYSTLEKRLSDRSANVQAWCSERNEKALTAFQSEIFAQHIATDKKSSDEILAEILSYLKRNCIATH